MVHKHDVMPHNLEAVNDEVINQVIELCNKLNLNEFITDSAIRTIKLLYNEDLYKGRPSIVLIGGVIFAVCRSENVPITSKNISEKTNVNNDKILQTARYILRRVDNLEDEPISWLAFLDEYCEELTLEKEVKKLAKEIGQIAEHVVLSGRKSSGYAAAAIYSATKKHDNLLPITQSELSELSGASESTIRITYQEQLEVYNNYDK